VPELVQIKVSDLIKMEFLGEMAACREEILETSECEMAFCYPSGKFFAHNDFYTLLRRLPRPDNGAGFRQTSFKIYIQTGKLGTLHSHFTTLLDS